jgi:hypothetical protein
MSRFVIKILFEFFEFVASFSYNRNVFPASEYSPVPETPMCRFRLRNHDIFISGVLNVSGKYFTLIYTPLKDNFFFLFVKR